jgi:thiamine kinase-like enzyme
MNNYQSDRVFQSIQQIYNPAAIVPILQNTWQHWRGEIPTSISIQPSLTYYRPFDRARLVADLTVIMAPGEAPIKLHLFFNVFSHAETAISQVEQGYQLAIPPNAMLPVFAIPDWHTAVWTLPHAPCLPELTDLLQPEHFCPLLIAPEDLPEQVSDYPAPQLFRYVPFKRAILTWDSPKNNQRYFVKLCTEAEFPKVVNHFQQIYQIADRLGFTVPTPIAHDTASRTFSMRAIPGQQFSQIMLQTGSASQRSTFSQVGTILAELHHADLHPLNTWTATKELKTFTKAMAEVKLALPHLSASLDHTIAILSQLAETIHFPNSYPIHANLFGDQILCDFNPAGDLSIGMVDWDTLSFGDPHYDIGRLIAHYIYLAGRYQLSVEIVKACIASLITAYEAEIDWPLDRTCLTWHITMQILLRAKISSLRKLPDAWQSHLEFAVAEAEWLLEGCSSYVELPSLIRANIIV